MQTKALLLAALGSVAVAQSTTVDSALASSCAAAVVSVVGAIGSLPTPTSALASYLMDAQRTASDPCSWVASAPSSLSSDMSSYSAKLSSVVSANAGALSQLATCASAVKGGASDAASLTPFMHITDCKAPAATATGAASQSKNAAPAHTGVAAVAGVAAAALIGVAGLI